MEKRIGCGIEHNTSSLLDVLDVLHMEIILALYKSAFCSTDA